MPRSIVQQKVRAALGAVHPNYQEARQLGPRALKYLRIMLETPDERLAPRAAYLAALIGGARGARIVELATRHPSSKVRIYAAFSLLHLPHARAEKLLWGLLADSDADVACTAVRVAGKLGSNTLRDPLSSIAAHHPLSYIRDEAKKALTIL